MLPLGAPWQLSPEGTLRGRVGGWVRGSLSRWGRGTRAEAARLCWGPRGLAPCLCALCGVASGSSSWRVWLRVSRG